MNHEHPYNLANAPQSNGLSLHPTLIVDRAERNRLVIFDPSSAPLIHPLLRRNELKPWHCAPARWWAILIPPGYAENLSALATKHPAIGKHLAAQLHLDERWWVIDRPRLPPGPQIVITPSGVAAWNESALAVEAPVLVLANAAPHWLAFLGSTLGERFRNQPERLRLPVLPAPTRSTLDGLVLSISGLCRQRSELEQAVLQRLLADFAPPGIGANERLSRWWELEFEDLRSEIVLALANDIPLRLRETWEQIHAEQRVLHQQVSRRISTLEATIEEQVQTLWRA